MGVVVVVLLIVGVGVVLVVVDVGMGVVEEGIGVVVRGVGVVGLINSCITTLLSMPYCESTVWSMRSSKLS